MTRNSPKYSIPRFMNPIGNFCAKPSEHFRKWVILIFLVALVFSVLSCKKWIDPEINTDPNNPSDITVDLLLPSIQASWAYLLGGELSMAPRLWMQQLSGAGAEALAFDRYSFTSADVSTIWRFNSYPVSLADTKILIEKSEALGYPAYKGVAQVLWAMQFLTMTDLFGDIPYSQALVASNDQPRFDAQESIFTDLDKVLNEAIENLENPGIIKPSGDDLIYSGNLALWKKAAYAVRARLYMRWGQRDSSKLEQVQQAINSSFESSADDMVFQFGESATTANPVYQFLSQNKGDMYLGHYFVDQLNNSTPNDTSDDDLRLQKYAIPITDSVSNFNYGGNGTITLLAHAYAGSSIGEPQVACLPGEYVNSINSEVPFLSYVELKFIQAEIHAGTATGVNALNAAINASYQKLGIDSLTIPYTSATVGEVIAQKYLALAFQLEVWNDWRRTGYPIFTNTFANSAIPVRFPYATDSYLYNEGNVPKRTDGARITIYDPVWWDVQE